MKKEIKKCPMCLGKGKLLQANYVTYSPKIREKARMLYRKGFSLRKIGAKIGVIGAQKVKSLIMAKTL